jgi:hypothetical protein
MSKSGVPVQLQPRTLACHGVTAWHADSALLVCSFEYGADPKRAPATVAERIDAALGISATPPRALLGDVDVIWQDQSRLHSIELRTGRNQWEPSSLGAPTGSVEESSMSLGLDYDVNHVASIELDVRVLWDAQRSCIALRFVNTDPAHGRWVAIADNVFVCIDGEQALIEIRFEDVQMESGEPPN